MTKLNFLLLVAVIVSALVLVKTAYDARRLFTDIHRAETEALRLAGDHKRLEADRQLQATNLRVERTARERLGMNPATPPAMLYEDRLAAAGNAAASAANLPAARSLAGARP